MSESINIKIYYPICRVTPLYWNMNGCVVTFYDHLRMRQPVFYNLLNSLLTSSRKYGRLFLLYLYLKQLCISFPRILLHLLFLYQPKAYRGRCIMFGEWWLYLKSQSNFRKTYKAIFQIYDLSGFYYKNLLNDEVFHLYYKSSGL